PDVAVLLRCRGQEHRSHPQPYPFRGVRRKTRYARKVLYTRLSAPREATGSHLQRLRPGSGVPAQAPSGGGWSSRIVTRPASMAPGPGPSPAWPPPRSATVVTVTSPLAMAARTASVAVT